VSRRETHVFIADGFVTATTTVEMAGTKRRKSVVRELSSYICLFTSS